MNRDQLLEYLEHFTSVTDGNCLAELIGRFTLGMGYDYYRFALILPMSMQRPKVVLFNRCPDSWVQAYTENNMLACDPVIQLARKQTLPIYWNRLDERASFLQEGSMDVMGLAAEFGLRNGISFPCTAQPGERHSLLHHGRAGLERSAAGVLADPLLDVQLHLRCGHSGGAVQHDGQCGQRALTERETECLFWASEGKTSSEIACILGITERTVNYHLNQVTRKTGSMNRYQAIAKGVGTGLLLPNLEQVVVTNFPSVLQ